MEASILYLNTTLSIPSSRSSPKIKSFQTVLRKKQMNKNRIGCLKVERKLEGEMNLEGDAWMMELGELKERGMVETLECLENEAIMGEDEGKNPVDYQRRAQIFDKSSRVFQALKEHSTLKRS